MKHRTLCLSPNRLRALVPSCDRIFEISVIGEVTTDGRMVAEHLVLHGRLASADRVEEICLMRGHIAVALRRGEGFRLDCLVVERSGLGMFGGPLRQIFLAE